MTQCLKEVQGRIEFVTEYKGKTAKDIRERMDEVMAARGEGLVIKHPKSKYVLNGRNLDWIKECAFISTQKYPLLIFDSNRSNQNTWFVLYSSMDSSFK
jgi:ATP-dependent DNA ligase